MVEMDSPHIRGIASSGILSYVKSKQGFLGTQGIVQIFERECPAEIHTKLDDIKESDWYPMEFHIILLKCAAKVVGPERDNAVREATLLEVIDARRTLLDTQNKSLGALVQAQTDCARLDALTGEESS